MRPGQLQHLANRRHRADAEAFRLDAGGREGDEAAERRQAALARERRAEVTMTAAAPSLVCDELPAVTVPAT